LLTFVFRIFIMRILCCRRCVNTDLTIQNAYVATTTRQPAAQIHTLAKLPVVRRVADIILIFDSISFYQPRRKAVFLNRKRKLYTSM